MQKDAGDCVTGQEQLSYHLTTKSANITSFIISDTQSILGWSWSNVNRKGMKGKREISVATLKCRCAWYTNRDVILVVSAHDLVHLSIRSPGRSRELLHSIYIYIYMHLFIMYIYIFISVYMCASVLTMYTINIDLKLDRGCAININLAVRPSGGIPSFISERRIRPLRLRSIESYYANTSVPLGRRSSLLLMNLSERKKMKIHGSGDGGGVVGGRSGSCFEGSPLNKGHRFVRNAAGLHLVALRLLAGRLFYVGYLDEDAALLVRRPLGRGRRSGSRRCRPRLPPLDPAAPGRFVVGHHGGPHARRRLEARSARQAPVPRRCARFRVRRATNDRSVAWWIRGVNQRTCGSVGRFRLPSGSARYEELGLLFTLLPFAPRCCWPA